MNCRCGLWQHGKLAASVVIALILWSVSMLQETTRVSGAAGSTAVSIVQAPSYPVSDSQLETMVRDAVMKAGGLQGIIHPGDRVVIKPNIVETTWVSGSGVITDIRVIRTVVRMAQEAGAGEVIIAEGTAAYRYGEGSDRYCTRKAFKDSGLDTNGDMRDDVTGVQLYDLNIAGGIDNPNPDYVTLVTLQDGILRKSYYVPNILLDRKLYPNVPQASDVLISVPVFKNHANAQITGSLKNRVGCAPNDLYHAPGSIMMKSGLVHYNSPYGENETVARSTVDLNRVRPAEFTVMDALIGITNGPTGTNKPNPYVRCIMAGRDAAAVDTIQALMMAYNPDAIPTITFARQVGFGQTDPRYITVIGKSVDEVRNPFPEGYAGAVRVELTDPIIGDMTPTNGSTVSGIVRITTSGVSDNVGVIKAELYVDNELYAIDTQAPYSFAWDTNAYGVGPHSLKVKVYDAALNEASLVRNVTVDHAWSLNIKLGEGPPYYGLTLGCRTDATDGIDAYDVPATTSSPYIALVSMIDSLPYSVDYRAPLSPTGEIKEWQIVLKTDMIPGPSTVSLSWADTSWSQIPSALEFQLIDHGLSWTDIVAVYNMKSTTALTIATEGTGTLRYLTVRVRTGPLGRINHYKFLPNGEEVYLARKVVIAGNDQLANTIYVSELDGSEGIRISHSAGAVPTVSEGDLVNVYGTLSTINGERAIISPTVEVIGSGCAVPKPKSMPNRNVGGEPLGSYVAGVLGGSGPNNLGMLITTWGRVTNVDSTAKTFSIDDGSGRQTLGIPGLRVHCGGRAGGTNLILPEIGDYVLVTGISTSFSSGSTIISNVRPRKQSDIVVR